MISDEEGSASRWEESQKFVYTRTYSRWRDDLGRRETWDETVDRFMSFIKSHRGDKIPQKVIRKLNVYIRNLDVMPSMRLLWAAGAAAESDNTTAYNCSFMEISSVEDFSELLYILMCQPKGSLVETSEGLKEIEKIKIDDFVWSYNHVTNKKELKRVLKIHTPIVNKNDQMTVKTIHGEFGGSKKHSIAVYDSGKWVYKTYKDLKVGDIVQKMSHWEDNDSLAFNEKAWWAGAFLGDGCYNITKSEGLRIRMSGDNESLIDSFCKISELLSEEDVIYKKSSNKIYTSNVWLTEKSYNKNNTLSRIFFDIVGDIPQKKTFVIKVPNWIYSSSDKNVFLSFLAGLIDTDGTVTKENKIQISTSSSFLIDDLKNCFGKFSIPYWISETKVENYNSTGFKPSKTMYKINFSISSVLGIENLLQHDLKAEKIAKQNNFRKWWSKRKLVIPEELLPSLKENVAPQHYWHLKKQLNTKGYIGEGYFKTRIPREFYLFDRIVSIDTDCNYDEQFYDLTVEDNHNYYSGFKNCYLMHNCGTGVGFSVSKDSISKLPEVPAITSEGLGIFIVEDSKAGWADSVKELMLALYAGKDLQIDYSKVRKKGERLKTMGGRASGPEPLISLHQYIRSVFQGAQGRKLKSLEIHDIMCHIAESVVVAGVRRSSLISLSDLDDVEMRDAKIFPFPVKRFMANNSAIYDSKPSAIEFLKEWAALAFSGSGERGIFNRMMARENSPDRRNKELIKGVNPCSEISLRSMEFCNLSEIVVRSTDSFDDLLDKAEAATWLGVIQSTFTYFPYLRKKWQENCEEERLLGVSITGQYDAPHLMTGEKLSLLKARVLKVAKRASKHMEINMPAATTAVKPSGTVAQICNSSSGLHPRYAPYYIRRYRIAATDPLLRLVKDQGVPASPENGQRLLDWEKADEIFNQTESLIEARKLCNIYNPGSQWHESLVNTWVLSFPSKSPEGAITVKDVSAIDQLEWYKKIQKNWCEHNASITVYVKDDEWMKVGEWVYANWDCVVGVSFLPADSGSYEQAPYEEIDEDRYELLLKSFPSIDYSVLSYYENQDMTEGAKSYACISGACEL